MDRLLKVDVDQYLSEMRAEMERALRQVAEAVNSAPEGNVISGSEMQVRDVARELCKTAFERAVQMRIDSTESSFSPSQGQQRSGPGEQGSRRAQRKHRQRSD